VIRAEGVSVRFGPVVALGPVSLEVAPDERLAVVGRNGSGKTTLLRVLAGLLEPTEGRVVGMPPRGQVVLVHQRPHLFRGTALHNVLLGARAGGTGRPEATALLARLGVEHLATRRVEGLSGGERRRVALARALARRPAVLLLDEPTAELDAAGVAAVAEIVREFRGPVVVASPDPGPVGTHRDLLLDGGARSGAGDGVGAARDGSGT
jgi:tungstate transport system ATP-binding protein